MATYTCPWCGCTAEAQSTGACSRCGAPVDVRRMVSESGWSELPAVPDMSRIQCGRSHCQIEGSCVPVVDFTLAEGDGVYFGHHELLWMEPAIRVEAMAMRGAWTRMRAGLPVVMSTARGPGRVAFSKDLPGEVIALPLDPGHAVDVREHVFLVATRQVAYGYEESGIWFVTGSGNDATTHYPLGRYVDRFSAAAEPGLLVLHAHGNAFVRSLGPGEQICVKPAALLYKDTSVVMHLHLEYPSGTLRGWSTRLQNRYVWLVLRGPGRVAVQSAYEHFEDPREPITRFSGTRHAW